MPDRLYVHRTLPAALDQVWQRWTTREGLATWWWTQFPDTTYEVDCAPGGAWRVATDLVGIAVHGCYDVVDPSGRLAFTWIWEDHDGDGAVDHVDVRLSGDGDTTRLDLVHAGSWHDREAEDYTQAWNDVLDSLEAALNGAR